MQFYYTYVLESQKDNHWYTGYTNDIHNRVSQHKLGQCRSTRDRLPIRLIYYEACLSRLDAIVRERYLKSGMGKRYIRNRLKTYFSEGF